VLSTEINKTEKLADNLYCITEAESTNCYLIVGSEKALLFDVGYGFEDISPIIKSITDLPVMIVVSHGDPDHGLGVANYEKMYIHPLDYGKLLFNDNEKLKRDSIDYRVSKLPRLKDFIDVDRFLELKVTNAQVEFLYEGDCIDLGGIVLDVILMPGHSYGHIALLDKTNKRLFSGDAITHHNIWYFGPRDYQAPFSLALDSYKEIRGMSEHIEEIYPAHNVKPIDTTILDDLIECLETEIKDNYHDDIEFKSYVGSGYQHRYKQVNLIYNDARLAEFIGKEIIRDK